MSDAPEKIWVGSDICHDGFGPQPSIWKDKHDSYESDIEYTRSDISQAYIDAVDSLDMFLSVPAQARIKELETALKDCSTANRLAFNRHENFYKMMSAVDAVVDEALKDTAS